jgi:hypothetical protein
MMGQVMTEAEFESEIANLAILPRAELVERWDTFFQNSAPKGLSKRILISGIAYQMQVRRYGDLKPAVHRRLQKLSKAPINRKQTKAVTSPSLQPGTRLVREWNGHTHVVEVMGKGFIWNNERHRSLSAIARAITGARWSGPRFFGVKTS